MFILYFALIVSGIHTICYKWLGQCVKRVDSKRDWGLYYTQEWTPYTWDWTPYTWEWTPYTWEWTPYTREWTPYTWDWTPAPPPPLGWAGLDNRGDIKPGKPTETLAWKMSWDKKIEVFHNALSNDSFEGENPW